MLDADDLDGRSGYPIADEIGRYGGEFAKLANDAASLGMLRKTLGGDPKP